MNRGIGFVVLLLAGAQIAGCHKAAEQPPENRTVEAPAPPVAPPPPIETPRIVDAAPKPPKLKPARAPEPSADQQMQDDAEASGMTSRDMSDGDAAPTEGNAAR